MRCDSRRSSCPSRSSLQDSGRASCARRGSGIRGEAAATTIASYVRSVSAPFGRLTDAQWQAMLETEFGGMEEVLAEGERAGALACFLSGIALTAAVSSIFGLLVALAAVGALAVAFLPKARSG